MVSGIDLAKKDIFGARWVFGARSARRGLRSPQVLPVRWFSPSCSSAAPASTGNSSKPGRAEPNQVIAGGEAGSEAKMNPKPVIFFF